MFKISPIQSIEKQIEAAEAVGTNAKDGYFAYEMRDNESGALMGFSQFEIRKDFGYLSDLLPFGDLDYEAMFILGRATMNFIDLCGVHILKAPKSCGDDKLLHAIGLRDNGEDELICDMTGFFDGHCDGK